MRKYSWRGKTEEAEVLKHAEHLLFLFSNTLGSFKPSTSALFEIIKWIHRSTLAPQRMFSVQYVLPSWVTLCSPQSPALVLQMLDIPLIYLSRIASNYLRFCGFISKPTFCSCKPFQAKGGARATRKSLNFLTLGGSWGEQEPPQLPGMQLGGRFCTPSLHTGCEPFSHSCSWIHRVGGWKYKAC